MKILNSKVRPVFGILLIAVLMTFFCSASAYAAGNNPEYNTLDIFPALGDSSDTMDANYGMINTLYGGGTVKDNMGTVFSSRGTVYENHGTIESLIAGHVGTNNGTICYIENTGSLSVNDTDGTVLFVGMGNVVDRNYGTIQENYGKVSENFGTVSDNCGSVTMYDGQIVNNCQNGSVTFEAKLSDGAAVPAKGTIENNEGHVIIHSGTVTITENTGDIEINNATVTVENNSGNITVGSNAALICTENTDSGVITKSSESAVITCTSNNGHIIDETAVLYRIVFVGDDGKAVIIECDLEKGGEYYTTAGGGVVFSLPPAYECGSARKLESGDVNIWGLNAAPAEGDAEFTVICHRCSSCDSQGHSYGKWVIVRKPSETETGIKKRTCSVCGEEDTDVIPAVTHSHNGKLQKGTSATCTAAGTKDCYICSCGKAFEDEACNIEITDPDTWKAEGGSGYIAPSGHSFNTYTSNNDAACTADGTKSAVCTNGCGTADTAADTGTAKGHSYGEWVIVRKPSETETGIKERTCSVCGDKDTDVIPDLTHTHNGKLQKGTSATCVAAGTKDCYICSCGKAFEDEACNIEITDPDIWKAEGGSGYIAPSGHSFNTYTSNNDAACTADGTKSAVCANGCGTADTAADTGTAKGHSYGEWVTVREATETETGIKEHICSVCDGKETKEIPVLTPVSIKNVSDENREWTKDSHTVEIVFNEESTSADLTVKAAENPASAGPTDLTSSRIDENGHVFPWIALLSVCSGILVGIAVVSKVKKKAE